MTATLVLRANRQIARRRIPTFAGMTNVGEELAQCGIILTMAKILDWARNIFAKCRASNTVSQFFMRLWLFLNHWKWGAGALVIATWLAWIFIYRDALAKWLGFVDVYEGMSPGMNLFASVAGVSALVLWALYRHFDNRKLAREKFNEDQFSKSSELMTKATSSGAPDITARVSGINIKKQLAVENPAGLAERVVVDLITYIKSNAQATATPLLAKGEIPAKPRMLGEDVKVAFAMLHGILADPKIRSVVNEKILDFSHQDFSYLDVGIRHVFLHHYNYWTKTDFRGAGLHGAIFNGYALLDEAKFDKADMLGVIFREGANLMFSTMTEVNLTGAKMNKVKMPGVDLRGAFLNGTQLHGTNLLGAKMQGAELLGAKFDTISNKRTERTILSLARFDGAKLIGVNLCNADMEYVCLYGCSFDADLHGANLSDAKFMGAYMANAKISANELTENVIAEMNGKIIHADAKSLADKVEECPDDFDWHLEKYEDSYALNGVLDNFAQKGGAIKGGLALRKQAWKLRDSDKLSQKWRDLLKEIDPTTGRHKDDK